jgi:hypothetical protein
MRESGAEVRDPPASGYRRRPRDTWAVRPVIRWDVGRHGYVPPMHMLAKRGHSFALISVAGSAYNKAFDGIGLDAIRQIRRGTLHSSQFPLELRDAQGRTIRKPPTWT